MQLKKTNKNKIFKVLMIEWADSDKNKDGLVS